MVSLDSPERNREFAKSVDAKLTLLSDPDGKVAEAYGVLAQSGKYARRWSFLIDPSGVIRRIDREVRPGSYGTDLLRTLGELDFGSGSQ
jgi:peroxiredoxin Q/BCP